MQEPTIYRGIEFIRVSELPDNEQLQIKNWAVRQTIIKILTTEGLLTDCITYKNYKHWYDNIFTEAKSEEEVVKKKKPSANSKVRGLAFDS